MSRFSDNYDNEEYFELYKRFEGLRQGLPNSFFDEEEFERLIEHMDDREKYRQALEIAEIATTQYPYSSALHIQKANILIALGRFTQALTVLQQTEMLDSSDTDLYILKIETLLSLNRFSEAESEYEHALNIMEGDEKLDFLFEMSDLFDEFEEFEKVFDCLVSILKIDPQNEEALFKICFWTDLTGRNEESIRLHQEILEDYPFNEVAWFNLGAAYQGIRLHEKAIDAYLYATAINDKFEYAYRNLGDAYLRLRKYRQAIEMLEIVIELGEPDLVVFEALGHCYHKIGEYKKAREFYRKGININPEDSQLHYKIGLSYMAEENWNTAAKSLETAIKMHYNQVDYHIAIAQCYVELEQYATAIEHFSFVLKSRPKNLTGWMQFLRCLYNAEMFEEGLQYSLVALHQTANKPVFLYFKALFELAGGKNKEALLSFETALEANPKTMKKILEIEPGLLQYQQIVQLIARHKKKKHP